MWNPTIIIRHKLRTIIPARNVLQLASSVALEPCHHPNLESATGHLSRDRNLLLCHKEEFSSLSPAMQDIEDLHSQAILKGQKSYEDSATGFTVFTELFHLERGTCCGNQCRHCPYGWTGVFNPSIRRPSHVISGNPTSIQQRLQEIALCQQEAAAATAAAAASAASVNNKNNHHEKPNNKKSGGTYGGRFTEKNVPYTRKGDSGTSQLLTGERRSKNDVSFEAMGTVDELCAVVGVAHALLLEQTSTVTSRDSPDRSTSSNSPVGHVDYGNLPDWLLQIMSRLFDAGSHIAKPAKKPPLAASKDDDDSHADTTATTRFQPDGVGGGLDIQHVEALEDWIDIMTEDLPELRNFILPTGSVVAAQFHVCRTVCRRAERHVVPMVQEGVCDPNVMKYLNRLSDFLFTAARWCNYCQNKPEIEYRRPDRRDKQRVATSRDLKTTTT